MHMWTTWTELIDTVEEQWLPQGRSVDVEKESGADKFMWSTANRVTDILE